MRPGRQIEQTPDKADKAYNAANDLQRAGQFELAVAQYDRALKLRPKWPEALTNRGVALLVLDRAEEAVASYDRALAIRPTFALALSNRGNALCRLGRHQQALMSYDQALVIQADYPEALQNRGTALHALGRYEEALASFDRVLAVRPNADALLARGSALIALRRPDEALESCIRAKALRPKHAETLNALGNALCDLNRLDEALAIYEQAIAIKPDLAGSHYNRGNVLQTLGRIEESLADYARAIALVPAYADALNNRGNALLTLRRNGEAAEDFARVLAIDPDYPYARGKLLHARLRRCDWTGYDQQAAQIAADIAAGKRASMPFENIAISGSPRDQLECTRLWISDKCPPSATPLWSGQRYRHDRIRLAYLSDDFHEHAIAYLVAGLFEHHDRNRFETIGVSFSLDSTSETRTRLKNSLDRFIDVRSKSDLEAATLLRDMEVDIAVDLMGLTGSSRPAILALRPAPVQVNYLGYPGTMGAETIDYVIADRVIIPESDRPHYSEKVVYLPDTYASADCRRRIADRTPSRAEAGLPETGFVFCSFNNSYKIAPRMFDIWMRLLREVDGSVLWLLNADEAAVANLRREASERGVAADRLVFAPRVKVDDHLARHRLADLFLDTLPYNAHTTASDALWAGLPLVTCPGSTFAGRVAGSLLTAVGLPELITPSLEDYAALALKLARDRDLLAATKAKLAKNRDTHPLFDTARFTRNIEAAYERMWLLAQNGEPATGFDVGG
jgi:predicted O-linked N-acetylglucosamine transferase (SPINDLY family)